MSAGVLLDPSVLVDVPTIPVAEFPCPTLLFQPIGDEIDWDWSMMALEWAVEAGYVLDYWQQWLVAWAFARWPDGCWAARDLVAEVARQNGKNIALEVIELVSLLLFGDTLIIHSAYRADVSHEHYLSLKTNIEASPFLMSYMPRRHNQGFIKTNGNESIEFEVPYIDAHGIEKKRSARLLLKARAMAFGRGPRPQKLILDEAVVLETTQVGTMAPGISAQKNPQVLFASSPPVAGSTMMHSLRQRAGYRPLGWKPERPDPVVDPKDRFFYAGWNNPPDTEATDTVAAARVNPSLGHGRLTLRSLDANRKLMTHADYLREQMGVPEEPLDSDESGPIDENQWASLADPDSKARKQGRALALAVTPDREWATVGVAGARKDGRRHVEWKIRKPGTGWVVAALVRATSKSGLSVRVHSTGPEGALISQLKEADVSVTEVSTADVARATGAFIDAVRDGQLRHLGQTTLTTQALGAVLRMNSEGSVSWAPRATGAIDALKAVTVAFGGSFVPESEEDGEWFAY